MTTLVDIDHETGDLTQYTTTVTDSGDLSVTAGSALAGSGYGLSVLMNDAVNIYGQKSVTATLGIARCRFYFDPNTMTMGNGSWMYMFSFLATGNYAFGYCTISYYNSQYRVRASGVTDTPANVDSGWVYITDEPHYIEFEVIRASAVDSVDGEYNWWLDGVEQTGSTVGFDNYDRFSSFVAVRFGRAYVSGTATGEFFLDELVVNDDGGAIGPVGGTTEQSISGGLTFSSTLTKQPRKIFTGALTYTGGLFRQAAKGLTGALTYASNLIETAWQNAWGISDSSLGDWTDENGGSTDIFNSIDEIVPNDSDYVKSPQGPDASVYRFKVTNLQDSVIHSGHSLNLRYRKEGEGTINLTVRLVEGVTTIATWTYSDISATFTEVSETLTELQANAISDYTNLYVELEANQV